MTIALGWSSMIYETGNLLAGLPLCTASSIIYSESTLTSGARQDALNFFSQNAVNHKEKLLSFRKIEFNVNIFGSRIL